MNDTFIISQSFGGDDRDPIIVISNRDTAFRFQGLAQNGRITRRNGLRFDKPVISKRPSF